MPRESVPLDDVIRSMMNHVKPILINTGYKYYSIVDKNFIIKLRLPRMKIPPKPIINFIKKNIKEPGWKLPKSQNSCHGASCMQANGAEGRKERSIKEGEGRERNLASPGVTAIYIDKKGKFRPKAGNNITRAKARHNSPSISKGIGKIYSFIWYLYY